MIRFKKHKDIATVFEIRSSIFGCLLVSGTGGWFRVFGWGLHWKCGKPLFSERERVNVYYRIPFTKYRIGGMKPLVARKAKLGLTAKRAETNLKATMLSLAQMKLQFEKERIDERRSKRG